MITVAEVDPFAATAARAKLTEEGRKEITDFLAFNPEAGDIIPGTGGVRKLRWRGRGKGTQGGYRVIYYFYNETIPLYLLAIYAKSDQEDLAPDSKRTVAVLVNAIKTEAKKRFKVRGVVI